MTNLFKKTSLGDWNDFIAKLAQAGLTAEMVAEVRKKPYLARCMVEALDKIDLGHTGLITVPEDATIESLVDTVKGLGLDYLHPGYYASWDFLRDEIGKTYEVLTWEPGWVSCEEVREHFKKLMADGNTAAFLAWVASNDPKGWYATVPSEDEQLFRYPYPIGNIGVPDFRGEEDRKLNLRWIGDSWDDCYTFVAFREVKNDTP